MTVTPIPFERGVCVWAYSVSSETTPGVSYEVSFLVRDRTPTCTCGDATWRERLCKHVRRVLDHRAAFRGSA